MTAIDQIRGIIAETLTQWGVAPAKLTGVALDTADHKGKAVLSPQSAGAVKTLRGRARYALGTVHVRAGHTLTLIGPPVDGAELVANHLKLEAGANLVVEDGSRFVVDALEAAEGSQITIKYRDGKDALNGRIGSPNGRTGTTAPAPAGLPFIAASIAGSFVIKVIGGNGGNGGAGAKGGNGGNGGNGAALGSITVLYGTMAKDTKIALDVSGGLKGGKGGAKGEGGKNGEMGLPGNVTAKPNLKQFVPPKPATAATKAFNEAVKKEPVFASQSNDFEDASTKRVAPLEPLVIKDESGNTVWDLQSYQFLAGDKPAPDTVNPSLWRNAQLNYDNGLFRITSIAQADKAGKKKKLGIYQARGLDLAVVTFIETEKSFIAVDPLTTAQMAKKAWEMMQAAVPNKPLSAIIYSHTHVDHDGGVGGLVEIEDTQGRRPKVKIIAPIGFMEEATSENVYAGTAMSRRATYMYGNLLPRGPQGQTGAGLGLGLSTGTITLVAPNVSIAENITMKIDGITVEFQLTPGTEAPAEMNIYFPDYETLHIAENCTHTLHNILTLRGAKVRDALAWANYLTESIELFGDRTKVMVAAHHWPTWGKAAILEMLESQRDMYKFLNDQVLQKLNQGYTIVEIGNMMKLPPSLNDKWYNQSYYGTVNHNSKAVYQRYIGWFDGVPAHLHPLDPVEEGKKYVEYMGGADALLKKAQADFDRGEYRFVATAVNNLVFADPTNLAAKALLADAYEQMGYQATSAPWRGFYLTGAQELRNGVAILPNPNAGSADTLAAMSMEQFLAYICILIDADKAADVFVELRLDLNPDDHYKDAETYVLRLKNAVLVFTPYDDRAEAPKVDATLTTTRSTLNRIIGGEIDFADAINDRSLKIRGDSGAVTLFGSVLVAPFNPMFNIVTP